MQSNEHKNIKMNEIIKKTIKNDGWKSLWRGLPFVYIRSISVAGIPMMTYELTRQFCDKK